MKTDVFSVNCISSIEISTTILSMHFTEIIFRSAVYRPLRQSPANWMPSMESIHIHCVTAIQLALLMSSFFFQRVFVAKFFGKKKLLICGELLFRSRRISALNFRCIFCYIRLEVWCWREQPLSTDWKGLLRRPAGRFSRCLRSKVISKSIQFNFETSENS